MEILLLGGIFAEMGKLGEIFILFFFYIYLYLSFSGFPFALNVMLFLQAAYDFLIPLRKFSNINLILPLTTACIP